MTKANRIQKMIEYLKTKDRVSRTELASYLNLDKKTVSAYVGNINSEGIYYIDCKQGRYGGYLLREKSHQLTFDASEVHALLVVKELVQKTRPELYPEYAHLCDKLVASYEATHVKPVYSYHKVQSGISTSAGGDRKKEDKLIDALQRQEQLEIVYSALGKPPAPRIVEPYDIVSYKGSAYLAAYCTLRKAFRIFKLSRVERLTYTGERFHKRDDAPLKTLLDASTIGLHVGACVQVKLRITAPFDRIISEKKWVEDQRIERADAETIIFEGTVSNDAETITWLLSMKDHVTVLEPESLKTAYRAVLQKMYDKNFNRPDSCNH